MLCFSFEEDIHHLYFILSDDKPNLEHSMFMQFGYSVIFTNNMSTHYA